MIRMVTLQLQELYVKQWGISRSQNNCMQSYGLFLKDAS